MSTFVFALLTFLGVMAMMAVGVIFSNRRIQGSCGGIGAVLQEDGSKKCGYCGLTYDEIQKRGGDCS